MEKELSIYACKDIDGKRLKEDDKDYRDTFFRDVDRILYSLSYIRYINKTQVFSFKHNDHLQKRMIHVQFVSKIARTIGRELGLNEDLIEAIALGHDLGHVPFGHVGEAYLNEISLKENMGYFHHNIQSVRLLMNIEKYGKGVNLNYQVLDGIMCHNGEIESRMYRPKEKTIADFIKDYNDSYNFDNNKSLIPCTLEGCVVRISDIIAYIGRDVEDALRLNIISADQIPENITKVLGAKNSQIVNTIVTDIIRNSKDKGYLKISDDVFKALSDLKKFNYENIYKKAYTSDEFAKIKEMFNVVYHKFKNDLLEKNVESSIFSSYLKNMSEEYKNNSAERIALDYVAGMTDEFFVRQYDEIKK